MITKSMASSMATTVESRNLPHHDKGPQEDRLWVQFTGEALRMFHQNPHINKDLLCQFFEADKNMPKAWLHKVRLYGATSSPLCPHLKP